MDGVTFGSGSQVALSMFLGTSPLTVEVKKGGIAAYDSKSFEGEYLYSSYQLNSLTKKKNVVTVLFPEDATHAKATMTRISSVWFSGAAIAQGDVVDYALESNGANERVHDAVRFRGLATLYRMNEGELDFFFVRQGRSFNDGQAVREGFASDDDVSIFIADTAGSIISPGTNVTFFHDGILGVYFDDFVAPIIDSGENWVRVAVPEGTWETRYLTPTLPGDANGDGMVNEADSRILAENWGRTGLTWGHGDFDRDGRVGPTDAAILAANWGQNVGETASTVPEPGLFVLMASLLPLVLRRRR